MQQLLKLDQVSEPHEVLPCMGEMYTMYLKQIVYRRVTKSPCNFLSLKVVHAYRKFDRCQPLRVWLHTASHRPNSHPVYPCDNCRCNVKQACTVFPCLRHLTQPQQARLTLQQCAAGNAASNTIAAPFQHQVRLAASTAGHLVRHVDACCVDT